MFIKGLKYTLNNLTTLISKKREKTKDKNFIYTSMYYKKFIYILLECIIM